MGKTRSKHHPPVRSDCKRERLAESSFVAVDGCGCGMLQVHLGALTLRMAPSAAAELVATIRRALQAPRALGVEGVSRTVNSGGGDA